MQIKTIKKRKRSQTILATYYGVSEGTEVFLEVDVVKRLIQLENFQKIHIRTDIPAEFGQKGNKYIDFDRFHDLLLLLLERKPVQADLGVCQFLLSFGLQQIKDDMRIRLLCTDELPQERTWGERQISLPEVKATIKSIRKELSQKVPVISKSWQLIYLVETNIVIPTKGGEFQLVKVGKTSKPIQEYISYGLQQNYPRLLFKPIIAKRLYVEGNEVIDKRFHKTLISLAGSKLFIKSLEEPQGKYTLHEEFYLLTTEFIKEFAKNLSDLVSSHQVIYRSAVEILSKREQMQNRNSDSLSKSEDSNSDIQKKDFQSAIAKEITDEEGDEQKKKAEKKGKLVQQELLFRDELKFQIAQKQLDGDQGEITIQLLDQVPNQQQQLNDLGDCHGQESNFLANSNALGSESEYLVNHLIPQPQGRVLPQSLLNNIPNSSFQEPFYKYYDAQTIIDDTFLELSAQIQGSDIALPFLLFSHLDQPNINWHQ